LLVRADGVQLLTQEQRSGLQQEQIAVGEQETALGKQLDTTRAMLAWRAALSAADVQLEQALANQRQAELKIADAKPTLDRLAASEPAEKLRADHTAMLAARDRHVGTARQLASAEGRLAGCIARCSAWSASGIGDKWKDCGASTKHAERDSGRCQSRSIRTR
jgi:exonuclease SbcC